MKKKYKLSLIKKSIRDKRKKECMKNYKTFIDEKLWIWLGLPNRDITCFM